MIKEFSFDFGNALPALPNNRRILEKKDDIALVALSSHGGHTIGVWNHHVSSTIASFQFTFGSFYNRDFGVDWSFKSSAKSSYGRNPYLVYQVQYTGE
ncbi:hypothetical protein N7453_004961 [Penicillium expansum]|nr:hypothetical protein N7453_004961 [Penicillium expansum]